jgi:hypothetical protein
MDSAFSPLAFPADEAAASHSIVDGDIRIVSFVCELSYSSLLMVAVVLNPASFSIARFSILINKSKLQKE